MPRPLQTENALKEVVLSRETVLIGCRLAIVCAVAATIKVEKRIAVARADIAV